MKNATISGASGSKLARGAGRRLGTLGVIAALIVVWEVFHRAEVGGRGTFPSPASTFSAGIDVITSREFFDALVTTLEAWFIALGISVILGVLIGGLLGLSDFAYESSRKTIDVIRAVPPVALIPVAVLTLGTDQKLAITLATFVCVWPVVMQTMAGVHGVDPVARLSVRSLRATRWQTVRWVVFPSTLPFIGTGIRLASVMSLLVCIGVQLLAGVGGLGLLIYLKQISGRNDEMFALIILTGFLGMAVTAGFRALERRATRWLPENR